MLVSYIRLIKAAWHTPLNGLSLPVACCSIWTCKKQTSFFPQSCLLGRTIALFAWFGGTLRATHLITCSRICKPKCLTTAGWALSANCKPHGTQSVLLSLNSSQNWWKIELGSVHCIQVSLWGLDTTRAMWSSPWKQDTCLVATEYKTPSPCNNTIAMHPERITVTARDKWTCASKCYCSRCWHCSLRYQNLCNKLHQMLACHRMNELESIRGITATCRQAH